MSQIALYISYNILIKFFIDKELIDDFKNYILKLKQIEKIFIERKSKKLSTSCFTKLNLGFIFQIEGWINKLSFLPKSWLFFC